MSNSSAKSGGIGFFGALFLVFLILKLGEIGQVATWSWWWVTSPLWIPFALIFAFLAFFGLFFIIGLIASGGKLKVNIEDKRSNPFAKKSAFQERLEKMAEERKKKTGEN